MVNRMLKHYTMLGSRRPRKLAIFGDAVTRSLAEKLGFRIARKVKALYADSYVALLQPGAVSSEEVAQVAAFVRDGGTCIVLGAFEENDLADLKAVDLIGFGYAVGTTDSIVLSDPPPLLAGLGPSDFFYRRFMAGILAEDGAHGWTGASGLVNVAPVGDGQVVYLAIRPEVFQVEWLPDQPEWQETEVYWPTKKFYRILSTILSNAGTGSDLFVDLKSVERSDTIYVFRALDFDPMESYTW